MIPDAKQKPLLYETVAGMIEDLIATGTLTSQERVPSIRAMSRRAEVSIATVNQAYQHLEKRGVIEARPRSGYYVSKPIQARLPVPESRNVRAVRPQNISTEAIDTLLQSLQQKDIVAMSSAVTGAARRLNGHLNSLTRSVLREEPGLPNELIVPPGLEALRREIAKRVSMSGPAVSADSVVVTSGAMDAIALSLGVLCKAGDTVIVETPTYFGLLQIIEHLNLKVVQVPNRPESASATGPASGICVASVKRVLENTQIAAAVLQPNFNNPTGSLTPIEAKRELMLLFTDACVPVIEDDIYGDLHLGPVRPPSLRAFDTDGTVLTCGSVSKTIALGYRIGWVVSERYASDIVRAKFCSSVACASLQQHVLARYFANGGYDRHLRAVRESLLPNLQLFTRAIADHFPDGTRVSNPAGGVVLWIELPGGVNAVELCEQAAANNIGITPGIIFSASADYRNFIRISYGVGWSVEVEQALRFLGERAHGH